MAHGKKDGFGYLDGVPIRIHEKCHAPRKVVLPVSFHYCSTSSLVNAQYDFTLETEVLKWTENYQEQLAALENAKSDKVAADIEEFTKLTPANDSVLNLMPENNSTSKPDAEEKNSSMNAANSSYVPGWQQNSILQPQQVSCQSVSNGPESIRRKNFNISDFENESSSPFDYMELQTINDLEELNNVFQDMSVVKPTSTQSANDTEQNVTASVSAVSQSNYECNSAAQLGCRTIIKRTRSHPTVDSIDIPYRNGYENSFRIENMGLESNNSLSNSVTHRFTKYPNSTVRPLTATSLSSYVPTDDVQSSTFHNLGGGKNSSSVSHSLPSGIRSCKSISDLSKLKGTVVSSSNNMDLRRPNTPPFRAQNSSRKDTTQTALPDPYEELSTDHQKIVLTIEEMGFPRGRVARAVRHLGEDSKKIIEHLCQVQKLIEAGYSDIDAEVALHVNEYKMEEATKFLDLTEQLRGLGFEKNAITRALVQHKNDRDKALDALLS